MLCLKDLSTTPSILHRQITDRNLVSQTHPEDCLRTDPNGQEVAQNAKFNISLSLHHGCAAWLIS